MRIKLLRAAVAGLVTFAGLALAASAPAGATTTASDLPAPTRTAPVTATGTGDPASGRWPTLLGVRVGRHERYDRTVFDFAGGTPSYTVRYAPLVEEGRGRTVPLAGAASLLVRFNGAYAYDHRTGASTIDLTRILNPRFPTLRQIRFGGAFEGYISAGLGLADRVGFRVFQLHRPDRVVVDVAHQPTAPFGFGRFQGGDGTAKIVNIASVRSGAHPGYDRLVFDLRTATTPLVFASYTVPRPNVITVGFVGLTTNPAVVSPPRVVHTGLSNLKGVSFSVYSNGSVTAWVETTRRHGFRVMLLSNPTRVVLDVAS